MKEVIIEIKYRVYEMPEDGLATVPALYGRIAIEDGADTKAVDGTIRALLSDLGMYVRGRNIWDGVEAGTPEGTAEIAEARERLQKDMDGWHAEIREEIKALL